MRQGARKGRPYTEIAVVGAALVAALTTSFQTPASDWVR